MTKVSTLSFPQRHFQHRYELQRQYDSLIFLTEAQYLSIFKGDHNTAIAVHCQTPGDW